MDDSPSFGAWLKKQRRDLDLTQEKLAEQAGCSVEMVRKIEAGNARPSRQLAELLATSLSVPAEEVATYVEWARTGAGRGNGSSEPRNARVIISPPDQDEVEAENPYKGLRAFQESDAGDFFGRESLTNQLVSRMAEEATLSRFLAVVGPSGSGKSSVVRAGLVPALRQGALPNSERWQVLDVIPGGHPMEEVEAALLRIAVNPPSSLLPQLQEDERGLLRAARRVLPGDDGTGLVLVLDQFEEVFTQTQDEAARSHFLGSLYAASSDPRSPLRIIATLRADFYDRPLLYRQPGELVRERTEVVLPMSADELERAIVRPAARVGVNLDPNLLAVLVQDVGEQPGTLPLLQYALTELFERREGRTMTLRAYQATGGVAGALGRRAEAIYNSLDYAGQEAARQLFLRLVTVGEGAEEDTRRRVRMSELSSTSLDEEALHRALDLFGRYRLLTFDREAATGAPTVEVAHEALLRAWGRVREWLEASRESLRVQRRLMSAAGDWLASERDPSFLAPGARLAQFEALAAERDLVLTADERAYLDASVAERERQTQTEQERQGRELALQKRAAGRLRVLVAALAVFLAIAVGLSLFAANNQAEADRQRVQAEIGFTRSEALRLAAEAGTVLQAGNQNELAALLAIRSAQTEHTTQGDAALGPASFLEYPVQRYLGHEGSVFKALLSPDGKRVLTASWDATARLWDAQTGKELRRFEGHTESIVAAAYSPNGRWALTGSFDGSAKLWDIEGGNEIKQFAAPNGEPLVGVAFSPDSKLVLTGAGDGNVYLWDVETGDELRTFAGHDRAVVGGAFSPDGKWVLTGSEDHTARLWDAQSGAELRRFEGHRATVYGVAFSPDGKYVLTGGDDKTARLWEAQTGRQVRRFEGHDGFVNGVAFSPDGKWVLTSSSDSTARLWDAQSGLELRTFAGHNAPVLGVAFSSDGKSLLTAGYDRTVLLWKSESHRPGAILSGHTNGVWTGVFSPDGSHALTASEDGTMRYWDTATGSHQTFRHGGEVEMAIFSPDGKSAVSTAHDRTVRLWDLVSGKEVRQFRGHNGMVIGAAISPDRKWLLTGGVDYTARIWDIATGGIVHVLSGHQNVVVGVAFSPDGKWALTGSDDNTARLWDVQTGKDVLAFKGHGDGIKLVAFSPDGKRILTASNDKTARLWDVETGQQIREFTGHTDVVYGVAFSPDGKVALTGSWDKTARLWDVETGEEIRRFVGHTDGVNGVAISPDGKTALTTSFDQTARLWPIDYHDVIRELCTRLTRDFTDEERERYSIPAGEATCAAP